MVKYEYRKEEINKKGLFHDEELDTLLERLGEEGWEAQDLTTEPTGWGSWEYVIRFKRKIQDEDQKRME